MRADTACGTNRFPAHKEKRKAYTVDTSMVTAPTDGTSDPSPSTDRKAELEMLGRADTTLTGEGATGGKGDAGKNQRVCELGGPVGLGVS